MSKENKIKYLINLMFIIYFIILFIERVLSFSLSIKNGINIFGNSYNIFVYSTIIISIVGFIIYVIFKCKASLKALFILNDESINRIDYSSLVIASGILLLSGMVHSEYTYLYIQFISYGFLILGILLQVVLNHKKTTNKVILWLSFVYLIFYSMSIPVTYKMELEYADFFHIVEGITTYLLVVFFTYMTLCIFNNKNNLFSFIYIIPAVILDIILITMRWKEVKNIFLLVFIILSIIMFIIGRFIIIIINKKLSR
ncbi:MAG: hypothetical protein ACI35S_01235 [Anaeroplasma sp.]